MKQSKSAHLVEVKRQLALKYENLAQRAGSQPKKKAFKNRAERYRRQVRQLQQH